VKLGRDTPYARSSDERSAIGDVCCEWRGFTDLLPADVAVAEWAADDTGDELHPAEEACVRGALPKRRREFAAGRACARRALRRLGIRDVPLLPGPTRSPLWPAGIVGSITHCSNYVAAAVARSDRLSGIGIDAEPAVPLSPRVVAMVCTPHEIARSRDLPPGVAWSKLLFSAKESFYKCYHPHTGFFLDFLDVELDIQPATAHFRARLIRADAPSICGRRQLEGRFGRAGGLWLTQVSV